jgi:hypothetical protein
MRIVHAANFTVKWNGEHFYTIPYKLDNGFTRLGHNVFRFCDRDVADSYLLGLRAAGTGHANRKLQLICEQVRPDLLLLGHCTLVSPETIRAIRAMIPGLRVAHWNCDPLFVPQNLARLKALAPLSDITLVTTAGDDLNAVAEAGGRVTFMPNPLDISIESVRAFDNPNADIDLLFTANPEKSRADFCETIRKEIPDLNFHFYGFGGAPSLFGAKAFDVAGRSKMGLSLSRRNDVFLYSSHRMSLLMGCGLLTLIDRRAGFDTIFRDDELVFFEGIDDLLTRIRHFKANDDERRHVARQGWQRAHAIFSETLVAQWILDTAFENGPSGDYAWPTAIHCGK